MNSEELEQSLRTEFENYLKDVLAEMKQEVSEFQEKVEAEIEKHSSQIGEVFDGLSKKIAEDKEIDISFKESVTEHLKLARDEGAKITAAAIAEAEDMREEEETPANFSDIRDAINEISGKDSQSEILKSLVHHSSQYTTRGAFFIVKNKHLVGWRVFGTEEHPNPDVVKEVYFPISSKTSLSESADTLATVAGGFGVHEDDSIFLDKLGFGEPTGMYSIPLVVRGRAVAVLYADRGMDEGNVNVEALESLIRVSGLTVDLLASNSGAAKTASGVGIVGAVDDLSETQTQPESYEQPQQEFESAGEFDQYTLPVVEESTETISGAAENEYQRIAQDVKEEQDNEPWNRTVETAPEYNIEETSQDSSFETVAEVPNESAFDEATVTPETSFESNIDQRYEVESARDIGVEPEVESAQGFKFQSVPEVDNNSGETLAENDYGDFSAREEVAVPEVETKFQEETAGFETQPETVGFETSQAEESSFAEVSETSVETVAPEPVTSSPSRSRFGDRNVDLPIEVAEGERRHHNDARRFARLLVSEIKLYNEQKVKEGRESADLYERLREAIDRSREMYEKRVQPPVAAKFDYFNYELVNTLAEGDPGKLGGGYPGASI